MANRIEYQELIDLDGYRKAVADSRVDYAAFVADVRSLNSQLQQSMAGVIAEIQEIKKANATSSDGKQQEQYANRVVGLTQQLNYQRDAVKGLSATEDQLTKVTGSLMDRQEKLLTQYANLNGTSAKVVTEKKRIAAELVNLQNQFNKLDKSVKSNSDATKEITGQYNNLQKQLTEDRKSLKSLDDAFDSNTNKLNKNNSEAVRLANSIRQNDVTLRKFDQTLGVHNRNIGNYPKNVDGVIASLTSLTLRYLTLDAAFAAGKAFVTTTAEMEQLSAGLRAVSRDSADFERSQGFLIETANKLGLRYDSLVKSYKLLKAATKDTSIEGATTEKIFLAVTTAGAKLKLSSDEVEGALNALQQMLSKGHIQAEELRGQLGDRLPGALKIMAEATGLTSTQLENMLKKGQLLAVDVLPKFATQLDKIYGGDAQGEINTMVAGWNRLTNEAQLFVAALNENGKVSSFFGTVASGVASVLSDLRVLVKSNEWSQFFAYLTGNIGAKATASGLRAAEVVKQQSDSKFRASSPGDRYIGLAEAKARELNIEKELNALVKQDPTEEGLKREVKLQQDLNRAKNVYNNLQKINNEQLQEESRNRAAKVREEADAAKGKADADKKKQDAANRKAQAEAEKRLTESLAKNKANTGIKLSGLDTLNESGGLSEVDYLNRRVTILQDGVLKEQAILRAAGKQNTAEYANTQKELNDIAADYLDKRNKLQEKAFKTAFDATRDFIISDERSVKSGLAVRLAELETAYEQEQAQIERNQITRKVSEGQAQKQLSDLKLQYLDDVQIATQAAYDTEEDLAKGHVKVLKDSANSEVQLTQATRLEKETIDKLEKERKDALAKGDVDRAKEKEKQITDILKNQQKVRDEIVNVGAQVAVAAVSGYVDIVNAFRDQDLANLEKQKANELALVGDNASEKANIEQKYAAKEREIKRKQAGADKAAALFQIAINTAVAASKVAYNPILLALTIALGAIQAAVVAARPLPEFYKGTGDAPEGPAWVGERGYELIESKRGGKSHYRLAAEKQVAYLNRHDRVYTHQETKRILKVNTELAQEVRSAPGGSLYTAPVIQAGLSEESMRRVMLETLGSQTIEQTILSNGELKKYIIEKQQRIQWKNEYFSLPKK